MREKHFWVLMLTAKMNYHLNCIKSFVQPVPAPCVPVSLHKAVHTAMIKYSEIVIRNDNIQSMHIATSPHKNNSYFIFQFSHTHTYTKWSGHRGVLTHK